MKRIITRLIKNAVVFLWTWAAAVSAAPNKPLNEQCDGFPKLPLQTADGYCVGLLTQRSPTIPLKMPRTAVETADGKLLVVDMGGWNNNKGNLWLVNFRSPVHKADLLLSNLNLPHKILRGQDGKYYLGETERIVRFGLAGDKLTNLETVVDGLPYFPDYLHPLKNFIFDKSNNLIVNIGSSSDHCNKSVSIDNCVKGTEAALRLYAYNQSNNSWDKNYVILATGLRNSMALAAMPDKGILQAENSLDLATAEEPFEEINLIEAGGFYGWPLCYDRNTTLDANKGDCSVKHYHEPWALLPPHVAPMDALYYHHNKLPGLKNKLVMSWHGYKIVGHRLVAFDVDAQGRPQRLDSAVYSGDPLKTGEGFKTIPYPDVFKGLLTQPQEIISHWNELGGLRPKGAPVGLSVMNDGSLLIVDDKNAAILRLSTGSAYKDTEQTFETAKNSIAIPEKIHQVLMLRCGKCHEAITNNPGQLLDEEHWLQKTGGTTRMEQKIFEDKTMPMPPDNSLVPEERALLKNWLQDLRS